MPPETRYAKSGDVHLAYQVVGEGPLDLVFVHGRVSNVEYGWEVSPLARFLNATGLFRTTDPLRPARHGNVEPRAGSRAAIVLPSGQPKRGAPS
jgi:hypothetical protein